MKVKKYFQFHSQTRRARFLTRLLHGAQRALHAPGLPVQAAALRVRGLLPNQWPTAHKILTEVLPAEVLVDLSFFRLF